MLEGRGHEASCAHLCFFVDAGEEVPVVSNVADADGPACPECLAGDAEVGGESFSDEFLAGGADRGMEDEFVAVCIEQEERCGLSVKDGSGAISDLLEDIIEFDLRDDGAAGLHERDKRWAIERCVGSEVVW